LQMFGRVREREPNLTPQQAGISLMEWDILDESALGFRLSRPNMEGLQIVFNQLLALRPKDASGFVLAGVKWLHFESGGSVQLGVHTLPGAALPVAARLVKLQAGEANFEPAFALPAIPALRLPATLVVPRGWFKPRIGVEIQDEALRTVTLPFLKPALVGADASHAWVQVYCPGTPGLADGWLELDPTNDLIPDTSHVRLALGRDYGDVTPLRGVIRGGGHHTLEVRVDTRRVQESRARMLLT